jgi:hypothetical protein
MCKHIPFNINVGFSRTARRAQLVSGMVGSLVPPEFRNKVVRLSRQVEVLFQPLPKSLLDAQETTTPSSRTKDQLESLTDIITTAAHLSIKIRLNRTIFYFNPQSPGRPYDPEHHENVDYPLYKQSKVTVQERADEKSNGHKQAGKAMSYRALIKFTLWPSIKRYSPGNGKDGDARKGLRIYEICKSRVVCYWGIEDRAQRSKLSLEDFVERERRMSNSRLKNMVVDVSQRLKDLRHSTGALMILLFLLFGSQIAIQRISKDVISS